MALECVSPSSWRWRERNFARPHSLLLCLSVIPEALRARKAVGAASESKHCGIVNFFSSAKRAEIWKPEFSWASANAALQERLEEEGCSGLGPSWSRALFGARRRGKGRDAHAAPDLSKGQAVLQRVVRDGHRASEVVGSVRALIKRDVQQKAPLDINVLIKDVVALLQTDIESEHLSLALDLSTPAGSVLADRVQLQQVILNLITNAIEAMRGCNDRPRALAIRTSHADARSDRH